MSTASFPPPRRRGEPAWEVAMMFPDQGYWSEDDFLRLSDRNWLVEYTDGFVDVLPMPTLKHQLILSFLHRVFRDHVLAHRPGALVLLAPYLIQIRAGQYREPDVIYLDPARAAGAGQRFTEGADLVMEVVSESNRDHDLGTKRREYAAAGIPEYWMVDADEGRITVLALEPGASVYEIHGVFGPGERATSRLLPGFEVDVAEALAGPP